MFCSKCGAANPGERKFCTSCGGPLQAPGVVREQKKQRHGCLTAYLILMIIANSLVALIYLLASSAMRDAYPDAPGWAFPALAVLGIVNVLCAIALFGWKKLGFFGFVATSLIAAVVNFAVGLNAIQAVLGLVGLVVLYGVLQIGKEDKGWPQLE